MKPKSNTRKVISLLNRLQPGLLPSIVICQSIDASLSFVFVYFASQIIDLILAGEPKEIIMREVFWRAGCNLVLLLTQYAFEKICIVKKKLLKVQIYQMLCKKTLGIDYGVLEKKNSLEMIQRAEEGMESHGDIGVFCDIIGYFIRSISCIVYSIILGLGLFLPIHIENPTSLERFLNSGFGLLLCAFVMLVGVLVMLQLETRKKKIEKIEYEQFVKLNRSFSYYNSFAGDYAQGKNVRLFRMKDMILRAYKEAISQNETFSQSIQKKNQSTAMMEFGILSVLALWNYLYVGIKAMLGMISLGSVFRYTSCLEHFFEKIMLALYTWSDLNFCSHYLACFYDYMELQNDQYDGTIPVEKRDDNQFEIEFKDVSFHYPNSQEMVLSHVNIKIDIGKKTAVVGKNGAGKTTFIKLLCRLYDPTEGEILLNGINIQYYDYDEYVRLLGVVFQDFQLFSFSVAENVAASTEYEKEKVTECLEKVGFNNYLHEMPQGIYTNIYQLEDDGIEISAGEAQKIAIARALYKDAPFVILDEPTFALDPVSEFEIYQHFDELVESKTSIYISHRMSSCRFCDQIYVFDEGEIVQKGSHAELMKNKEGMYCQLWEAQAQYYQK